MNLILLTPDDFIGSDTATLTDTRRVEHINNVHRAQLGDTLKVGLVNGKRGCAEVTAINSRAISLQVQLNQAPPPAANISLILGLPRPPMLKRTLQTIATLGVKQLTLLQSARVEKSYWQSPQLHPNKIQQELILGLEQTGDTLLPQVHFAKRFRPFMEDKLASLAEHKDTIIAHPYAEQACPTTTEKPLLLAIGPEGGFITPEVEKFMAAGFTGVSLGPRIMRVETVVPYLLGRLSG